MPTTSSFKNILDIFLIFLKLGLTSFGGPTAHLGYFRNAFVVQRNWLSEKAYADLIALCQFLPGPASSQIGMSIGLSKGGFWGAVVAWIGFTMPSAVLLIAFALGIANYGDFLPPSALHGLKIVAVAVVAHAVWGMAVRLCDTKAKVTIMAIATALVLLIPNALGQIAVIVAAGLAGAWLFKADHSLAKEEIPIPISRTIGIMVLLLFVALLVALPILASYTGNHTLEIVDSFYRSGSLVFGGGHVLLPLLQAEVVNTGWVSKDAFLAGYGAAQAVPGPLFTFTAFLGTIMNDSPNGISGGLLTLVTIFVPSFLLVIGVLPFWEYLRKINTIRSALIGVNAAVVGLLLAALYQPVFTNAIFKPSDFILALSAFVALQFWKLPPWLVVVSCGAIGFIAA
jgi:chromate transporter